MNIDHLIIAAVTVPAIALHLWLYLAIRRWMDRDLALSLAGEDPAKRAWMLQRLAQARREGVRRRDLAHWLQRQALESQSPEPTGRT